MRKEIKFKTEKGVAVTITVNPSGFIRIEREGMPPKSLALLSFAREALTNPLHVEPTEDGAEIYTANSVWIVDANNLTLVKSELEPQEQPQVQQAPVVEPAAEPARPVQTVEALAAASTSERKEVKPMAQGNGYRPRWMVALESILRAQGFSDEQIQHIIASVASDSRRRTTETFDTSTPEGKIMAMLAGLVKQCRKHHINQLTHTFRIGEDKFEVVYSNGTASLFRNAEHIASYPS